VRELTEIDLWEISLVTFPMLPEARVARVKTAEMASSDVDQSRLADLLRQGARRLRLPHFS
jgi:phage head maturation protease